MAKMEPIAMKIDERLNQSQPIYHNQWNGLYQQHTCHGLQSKTTTFKPAKGIGNRNTFNSGQNTLNSDQNGLNIQYFGQKNGKQADKAERIALNCQKMNEGLIIEWDCIDSFHEFAIYMDQSNPICPAEHLDTPEKLMNLLVF